MSTICLIADLGFGDCGKGSTTDLMVRNLKANLVVRYNGGPQAGHTVVLPSGQRHIFSQFGAGTFAGAKTFLSKHMLVNPFNMMLESQKLYYSGRLGSDPLELMIVSPDSLVITPYHVYANRLREEMRGDFKHGSCGMGVGEARDYSLRYGDSTLRVGDLSDADLTKNKLEIIRQVLRADFEKAQADENNANFLQLCETRSSEGYAKNYKTWTSKVTIAKDEEVLAHYLDEGNIVFEGAQGVLLDENFGFKPHNTWTTTTFSNAEELLSNFHSTHSIHKVGVVRCYSTRHGAGPLVTESADFKALPLDITNQPNAWQGTFRRGYLDLKLTKYAIQSLGWVDEIVLSHMDEVKYLPEYKVCIDYDIHSKLNDSLLKWAKPVLATVKTDEIKQILSQELATIIRITSYGPTYADKKIDG
jgi:adenylosuccinate synthase